MHRSDKSTMDDGVSHRRGGKKLLEWTFTYGRKKSVLVTVHLEHVYSAKIEPKLEFIAKSTAMKHEVRDSDIGSLHARVGLMLEQQADVDEGLAWEDWFEIKVRGDNESDIDYSPERSSMSHWKTAKAELDIEYRLIRRAVTASGRVVTVNMNGIIVDFPKPQRFGDSTVEDGGLRVRDSGEISYVKATPENVAAIERLRSDMELLRDRIAGLMSSDRVQETLLRANSTPLLTSGKNQA